MRRLEGIDLRLLQVSVALADAGQLSGAQIATNQRALGAAGPGLNNPLNNPRHAAATSAQGTAKPSGHHNPDDG
jgi:hypothetical protein